MKLPLRQSDEAVSELEACLFPNAQWLGFLIIYEDSDCGNEAMDLFRDLSGKISREHPCNLHLWKLGDMAHPEVGEGVIESLRTASVVIFAAQAGYQLPPETRALLDDGFARRSEKAGALVALLADSGREDQAQTDLLSYLRASARKAGLKYYARSLSIQPKRPAYTVESIHDRAETITSTLRRIMRPVSLRPRLESAGGSSTTNPVLPL